MVTMVYEKQPNLNGRPPLTASTPRLAGRGAVTPKLAGSSVSTTSSTNRKDAKGNKAPSTPTGQTGEDVSTPVKAFLSSNITPRSGSRRARVDGASHTPTPNSTPNGTPKAARPVSMVERWDDGVPRNSLGESALGISGVDDGQASRAQSVVSEGGRQARLSSRPSPMQPGARRNNIASPESLPKFFHADEAKPVLSSKLESQRPPLRTVFSGYTQHGGEDTEGSRSSLSTSPLHEEGRPKFFRANSSAEIMSPPSKPSNMPALRQSPVPYSSNAQPVNVQRAASPLKDEVKSSEPQVHGASKSTSLPRRSSLGSPAPKDSIPSRRPSTNVPSPRRHTRLASSSNSQNAQDIKLPTAAAPPMTGITQTNMDLSRRSSLNLPSPRKASHTKTSSTSCITYSPGRRSSIAFSDTPTRMSPVAPLRSSPAVEPLQSQPQYSSTTPPPQSQPTPPLSPTRPNQLPAQSKLDHMNELAAKARRERKVLDLEISNSSLLAINRTLEREMRIQKEEIRKLRRASRKTMNGRVFSMGTNRTVSSAISGISSTMDDENDVDMDLNGGYSSGADDDLSDPYNDNEIHSLSSSTSSPPPLRSSFAKDTKRFDLDLSRHRNLLIESQRLNQAMKRCLDTTESLILDGKKALDYHVDVSEIENIPPSPRKTGGRVLEPSEDDDDLGERGQGLLSPAIISSDTSNPWDLNMQHHNSADPLPDELGQEANPEWDIDGIGTAISSPLASPSPATSFQNPPSYPSDSDLSPRSKAALKTGWDAIKQDVKTPDGLRAAAPLGLGNYLQSLGWSPG